MKSDIRANHDPIRGGLRLACPVGVAAALAAGAWGVAQAADDP